LPALPSTLWSVRQCLSLGRGRSLIGVSFGFSIRSCAVEKAELRRSFRMSPSRKEGSSKHLSSSANVKKPYSAPKLTTLSPNAVEAVLCRLPAPVNSKRLLTASSGTKLRANKPKQETHERKSRAQRFRNMYQTLRNCNGEGRIVCGRCRNCLARRRHLCGHTQGAGVNHSRVVRRIDCFARQT